MDIHPGQTGGEKLAYWGDAPASSASGEMAVRVVSGVSPGRHNQSRKSTRKIEPMWPSPTSVGPVRCGRCFGMPPYPLFKNLGRAA